MIKIIRKCVGMIMAAALLLGGIEAPVPVRAQADGVSPLGETGVTVYTRDEFMNALKQKKSPITVATLVCVGDEADADGRMRPVMIPAGTVIQGTSNGCIISRSPIQLEGDGVVFQNMELHFVSTDALGSVPHREIFLAGHSLTLDNVKTYVEGGGADWGGLGGFEMELLPTVYAGGYSGTAVGGNASLTVANANDETMFQGIYMGHDGGNDQKVPYRGTAAVKLDAKAVVRKVVDTSQNSRAEIYISGTKNQSANAKKFRGNEKTTLTLAGVSMESTAADAVEIENVGNTVLKDKACLSPATDALRNVTLREGACLDFSGVRDAVIEGDFSGENDPAKDKGILVLHSEGSVRIGGTITGTTRFQTGHRLFPGVLLKKNYIYAAEGKGGESAFVLAEKYVENGFDLQYADHTWTVHGEPTIYREIGDVKIVSAPKKVDLKSIAQKGGGEIPDEDVYFEIIWYDKDGIPFSNSDIAEDYWFFDSGYVLWIRSDYWKSEDSAVQKETIWSQPVMLLDSNDHPGRYYLAAQEGYHAGEYTILFCSRYIEEELVTVEDVKALRNIVKAECEVNFSLPDSDRPEGHVHDYKEILDPEPACTEAGIMTYICSCGNEYTKKVAALGHQPVTNPAVPPTETTPGKTEGSRCSVCGKIIKDQETIPAIGKPEEHRHSYQCVVDLKATCTQMGIRTYACSCRDVYTEKIDALGHRPVADPAVPPTETADGKTEGSHCGVCGEVIKAQETVPATGKPETSRPHEHAYRSVVTQKATCTQTGIRTYTCSCGNTYTEKIALADHQYVREHTPATPQSSGKQQQVCRVCAQAKDVTVIDRPQKIVLGKTVYSYDGKVKKPAVTVKDSKGKVLAAGTDYRVSYPRGRKNPGVYTVTVEFQGNYSGRMTGDFTIKPGKTSLTKVTAKSKGIQVTWKKQTAQTDGYQIQYGTSKNFTGKSVKVTTAKKKAVTKNISKLKGKKKYYVRIRTYKTVKVNGKKKKLYSDWSAKKAVTTKK